MGGAALGSSFLLSGCIGGSPTPASSASGSAASSGPLTLQSDLSDPKPKAALEAIVKGYTNNEVTLNTVATEQFRAQLSTYLTSANPPDVITWLAGSVARDYASKGLLLDVSDMWTGDGACAKFSPALKALSSGDDGKQIFVPDQLLLVEHLLPQVRVRGVGRQDPHHLGRVHDALNDTLKGKGVYPLTNGTGSTAWMASGWFDYLDLRINGAPFHRELLAGKHSFDSAEVRKVMDTYATLIPYFDPKGRSYSWQEAATPLVNKKAGMYLIGAFVTTAFPSDAQDDIDFFSVPTIDPSIPSAEEAPTDGFFASAKTKNPVGTKDLLSYLASPEQQQAYIEGVRLVQPADLTGRRHLEVLPPGAEGHQAADRHQGDHPVLQPRLQRRAADHRGHGADQVPRPSRPGRHHPQGLAGRRPAGLELVIAMVPR